MKRVYPGYKKTPSAKFAKSKGLFRPGYDRTSGRYGRFQPSGSELKFHDVTIAETDISENGCVCTALLTILQNTKATGRIGKTITLKEIHMHGTAKRARSFSATGATQQPKVLRLLLVQDKQANGAAAVTADVLEVLVDNKDYQAFRNLDNSKRFNILYDKRIHLNVPFAGNSSEYATNGVFQPCVLHKKINIPIEYDAGTTTGAIGTIRSNNLILLLISSDDLFVDFHAKIRIRYEDL